MTKVTIFAISTGKYLDYFSRLLPEIEKFFAPGEDIQIILATDRARNLPFTQNPRISIDFVEIEALDWPEITLLRYHEILKHSQMIKGDYIFWLDSDMKLVREVPTNLFSEKKIVVALHPGYLKPGTDFLRIEFRRKITGIKVLLKQKIHRHNPWESRIESCAFLPKKYRRNYVHGAVWGGEASEVLRMCHELSLRIDKDKQNGVEAIWLDESHLNWYANRPKSVVTLLPKYFSSWVNAWQYQVGESYFLSLDKQELDLLLNND